MFFYANQFSKPLAASVFFIKNFYKPGYYIIFMVNENTWVPRIIIAVIQQIITNYLLVRESGNCENHTVV